MADNDTLLDFMLESMMVDVEPSSNITMEASNDNTEALTENQRKDAIDELKSAYFGKYPIHYFTNNKDKKHDKTIAEINKANYDIKDITNFMANALQALNKKSKEFTYIFIPKDGLIFANPKEKNKKATTESIAAAVGAGIGVGIANYAGYLSAKVTAEQKKNVYHKVLAAVKRCESKYPVLKKYAGQPPANTLGANPKDFFDGSNTATHRYAIVYYRKKDVEESDEKKYKEAYAELRKACKNASNNNFSIIVNRINGMIQISVRTLGDDFTRENLTTEAIGKMDITGQIPLECFIYNNFVLNYMDEGLSFEDAVTVFEANLIENPFMLIDAVSECHFATEEAYYAYLAEAFNTAYELAGDDDTKLVYDVNTVSRLTGKPREVVAGAKYAVKAGADKVYNAMKPMVDKLKYLVDSLIGDRATKEEVITGSYFLRVRRIFIKLILVYKSTILSNAVLAMLGPHWILASLIRIVLWISRMKFYGGAIRDTISNDNIDTEHIAMSKRCIGELEEELKITREKIEDARSSGDQKAKYELMRLESKIEQEIVRLRNNQAPTPSTFGNFDVFKHGAGVSIGRIKTGGYDHPAAY